ncbi:hypothetical protein DPMN_152136 [Dreissena polymorpha]|uniref:Uncharacterized protein n=1 Tax=Dreissena polymorpha TaxID=45954 RepID=A0A9D4FKR8_DREPO|nr:hypothetical protein DPMN_152136 [Dreissena polymorpha]
MATGHGHAPSCERCLPITRRMRERGAPYRTCFQGSAPWRELPSSCWSSGAMY